MVTTLADGLASAASLQEQWRFAAAREVLAGVLGQAGDAADRLAVVTGRRMFAEVLRDLGEVEEAYAIAGPLVDDCERRFGRGHPATARARTVLATTAHARGDLAAAADLYDSVLDGRFREDGPAGRPVRLTRAYRALLLRDRGEIEPARTELVDAHRALRRAYGITDPDTIRFGTELGRMHREAGDVPAARRVLAVARAGCQATLDPWHPLCVFVERELSAVEPALPRQATSRGALTREEWAERARTPGTPPDVRRAPLYPSVREEGPLPHEEGKIPAQRVPSPPRRRRRRLALVAVAAGFVVAALVAVALLVGWRGDAGREPAVAPVPGQGGSAPSGSPTTPPLRVQLRDDGTSMVVSWDDPDSGPAPVVVALARDGQPAVVVATVEAGTRQYTFERLDATADYCVIVGAVRPGASSAGATSVCARR